MTKDKQRLSKQTFEVRAKPLPLNTRFWNFELW